MKVTYKGKLDVLVPAYQKKLDVKLGKLAKVVDGREEREAHVTVTSERHIYNAEVTVNIHDHVLVGASESPDLLAALTTAIDKLEKQVRKLRAKIRANRRGSETSLRTKPVKEPEMAGEAAGDSQEQAAAQVFRVNHRANQKPLTLEEAMLEIEDGRNYFVYRDSESNRLVVLLRRNDGNFDLVEA